QAVINREYITEKRPTFTAVGKQGTASGTDQTREVSPQGETVERRQTWKESGDFEIPTPSVTGSLRGDNWVDGRGNILTDEPPRLIAAGCTNVYTSTIDYPDTR